MKKVNKKDGIRPEYKREDLGIGIRGKYYEAYQESHNVVLTRSSESISDRRSCK